MHATVYSGSILGVEGLTVEVEVDIARGIPAFSIVGLPNAEVRESRERVTAAIKNTGIKFPLERITVNLAPAAIKKEGAAFDLAIAVGIVLAAAAKRTGPHKNGPCPSVCRHTLFLGELTLGGGIRRVRGVLPILLHAKEQGFDRAVVPADNFAESQVVPGIEVYGVRAFKDVLGLLVAEDAGGVLDKGLRSILTSTPAGGFDGTGGSDGIAHKRRDHTRAFAVDGEGSSAVEFGDMRDVCGQESVKRALLVAAAGGHHVLMVGPPGSGKTMLAKRFASILPPLDEQRAIETTMIYSTAGLLNGAGLVTHPPFRAPHHSASDAGLIGGGGVPRPGEVTLAHNGVLFMDEFPEFKRHVLETLREPLEAGRITIARAKRAVTFPARFQLVAAMNPCPCGHRGDFGEECRCPRIQVERYTSKVSGPLLDRVSIHVCVRPVEIEAFRAGGNSDSSAVMLDEVTHARDVQRRRNPVAHGSGVIDRDVTVLNGRLTVKGIRELCRLDAAGENLLAKGQRQLKISARGRNQVLRVARTIADLEGAERIASEHLAEAIQYRMRELLL